MRSMYGVQIPTRKHTLTNAVPTALALPCHYPTPKAAAHSPVLGSGSGPGPLSAMCQPSGCVCVCVNERPAPPRTPPIFNPSASGVGVSLTPPALSPDPAQRRSRESPPAGGGLASCSFPSSPALRPSPFGQCHVFKPPPPSIPALRVYCTMPKKNPPEPIPRAVFPSPDSIVPYLVFHVFLRHIFLVLPTSPIHPSLIVIPTVGIWTWEWLVLASVEFLTKRGGGGGKARGSGGSRSHGMAVRHERETFGSSVTPGSLTEQIRSPPPLQLSAEGARKSHSHATLPQDS